MKRYPYFFISLVLALSACQVTNATPTVPPSLQPSTKPTFTLAKTGITPTPIIVEPTPTVTTSPTTASSSTPTSIPTPTATLPPMGLPFIHEQPGDLYTTVFSIPVGGDSIIHYRGGDNPDMEITGPDAIAVLPDDTFMIADLIANRLLHYDQAGNLLNKIELYDLGIVNVADLRVSGDKLFLLEISLDFSPPRYRVNQLSLDGNLITSDDIPAGFHIEDGLTGITIDCEGQIVLEMGGGSDMYRLEDIQSSSDTMNVPNGYYCNNILYRVVNSGFQKPPLITAGNVLYETRLTTGLGGLTLVKVFIDGSSYISRDDVVNDQVIKVDQTIHYFGSDRISQGVARVPLSEMYYPIMRDIAVNDRGEVFFLLPRRDSLDVVRLNFYQSLEPLPPSTVVPQITISTSQP